MSLHKDNSMRGFQILPEIFRTFMGSLLRDPWVKQAQALESTRSVQRFRKESLPERDEGNTRSTVNIVISFSQQNTMPDDLFRIEMAHPVNIRCKEQRLEPQRLVYSLGYRKLNDIFQKSAAFARTRVQTQENAMEGLPIPSPYGP